MKTVNDSDDREPDPGDPLARLADIGRRRRELDAEEYHYVLHARSRRYSWAEIGQAMGLSKQAAHKKFRRRGVGEGSKPLA